jgi:hypothetical protein
MSTTATDRTTTTQSSLASSVKFRNFALVFAMAFPVLYVVCDIFNLPLFTYHPATNMFGWGFERGRSGEGPAMYWYGWVASCLVGGTICGLLSMLVPERLFRKIPLHLLWILPTLAFIPLAWSLMPFWTKG